MELFEYKVLDSIDLRRYHPDWVKSFKLDHNATMTEVLNILGAEGWELVAIEPDDFIGKNYYFKRKKQHDRG